MRIRLQERPLDIRTVEETELYLNEIRLHCQQHQQQQQQAAQVQQQQLWKAAASGVAQQLHQQQQQAHAQLVSQLAQQQPQQSVGATECTIGDHPGDESVHQGNIHQPSPPHSPSSGGAGADGAALGNPSVNPAFNPALVSLGLGLNGAGAGGAGFGSQLNASLATTHAAMLRAHQLQAAGNAMRNVQAQMCSLPSLVPNAPLLPLPPLPPRRPMPLQTDKKERFCWTPERHSAFVSVVARLGGADKATAKQIRDRMQIPGLNLDIIKSHLQAYRYKQSGAFTPIALHSQ